MTEILRECMWLANWWFHFQALCKLDSDSGKCSTSYRLVWKSWVEMQCLVVMLILFIMFLICTRKVVNLAVTEQKYMPKIYLI